MASTGKQFSTPRNIKLRDGLLEFGSKRTSNPFASTKYGLYVDDTTGNLIFSTAGTSVTLGAAGSGSSAPTWDAIFAGDQAIQLGALSSFTIDRNSGNNDVLTITNTGAGSGDCIQITNVGTGSDIEGTGGLWSVSNIGDIVANIITLAGDDATDSITLTTGDIAVVDGSFTLEDADDAASLSITNDTATTASVIVFAGAGAFTGSTTTSFLTITPSGLTTGTAVYIPVAALTTGKAVDIVGDTAQTSGALLTVTGSGTTVTNTTGALISSVSSSTTGTNAVLNYMSTAATDETVLLKLVASDTLLLGNVINITTSAMTTGTGIAMTTLDALTTGIGLHIASAATAITTTGRLFYSNHTGATGTTATLNEFATSATDESILLKLTTTAMVTGIALNVVGTTGMTTGSLIRLTSSTAAAVATNGIVSLKSTGAFTSTSNAGFVDIGASALVGTGTLVNITSSNASQATNTVLRVAQSGVTTGYTGTVVDISSTSTTGSGSVLTVTGANTTAGNTVKIDAAAVTTGTGLLVTSAGVIITTGELVSLVANGATTSTGVLRLSATSLTDGWCAQFTGGGATTTSSGGVLDLEMGAATDGVGLKVLTSGVYTGTAGVALFSAAAATEGNIVVITGTGLTTGTALLINTTTATLTSGFYIRCNDGAATDFSVGDFGATVIAGSAVGTAALTITNGDIVLASGTIAYRQLTETVASTNILTAAETGKTCFLAHGTEFVSTLPAPAAGLHFKFIIGLAPSDADYTVVTHDGSDLIYGNAVSSADAGGSADATAGTPADTITFVGGQAAVGDWVEVVSDGTYWYAFGIMGDEDAITFTAT